MQGGTRNYSSEILQIKIRTAIFYVRILVSSQVFGKYMASIMRSYIWFSIREWCMDL